MIKNIVNAGGDLECKTVGGQNVLHFSAKNNHPNCLYFFMNQGMNLSEKDKHGNTPLHLAA
jgi:ankyrin repeat protein